MSSESAPAPPPPDAEPVDTLTRHFEQLSQLYALSDEATTSGNVQAVISYTVAEAQRVGTTMELLERNEAGLMMMSLADQMIRVDHEIAGIDRALPHVYEATPQTGGNKEIYEKAIKDIHKKKVALHDEKERLRLLMMYCQFDPIRQRPDGSYTSIGRAYVKKAEVGDLDAVASIDRRFTLDAENDSAEVKEAQAAQRVTLIPPNIVAGTQVKESAPVEKQDEQPKDPSGDLLAWGSNTILEHVRTTLGITPETEQPCNIMVLPGNSGKGWAEFVVEDGKLQRNLVIRGGEIKHHQLEHEYAHSQTGLGFAFGYGGIYMQGLNEAVTEECVTTPIAYHQQREVLQQMQKECTTGNPDFETPNFEIPELVRAAYKGNQKARDELYKAIVDEYGLRGYNALARMTGGSNDAIVYTDIELLVPCAKVMEILREEKWARMEKGSGMKGKSEQNKGSFTDIRGWLKKVADKWK